VTGTIDQGGTIGAVGGLSNKIKAARERNYTLLLPAANDWQQQVGDVEEGGNVQVVSNLSQVVSYLLER